MTYLTPERKFTSEMEKRFAVGQNLLQIRRERGLSQKELAKLAHIAQSQVCAIENADYDFFPEKTIQKICAVLDITEETLYERKVEDQESYERIRRKKTSFRL